jgi:hypothetical protein
MSRNFGRSRLITAMVPAMCAAGLAVSTPVHAEPPCTQWRFDGYTELIQDNGWKLTFDSNDSSVKGRLARAIPSSNAGFMEGNMDGGIYGDRAHMTFDSWSEPGIPSGGAYDGVVDADGFAHGTTYDRITTDPAFTGDPSSASWRSAEPLKCADAPPDSDVLKPDGVIQPDSPLSPF